MFLCALAICCCVAADKPKNDDKKDDSAEHAVTIKNVKFSPAALTIKVGETVVWTNSDDLDHTVVEDDGSFKSESFGHGKTFTHTFDAKGKFKYSCSYHPRMKGTITVTD